MHTPLVRRNTMALAALLGLTLLTACEDKRVKELQTGITRDSVLSITAKGTQGADSMPSIYKRDDYLINGHTLEVLWYDPENRKAGTDTVPYKKLTPLVMLDNRLVGKGWTVYDSVSKANRLPMVAK